MDFMVPAIKCRKCGYESKPYMDFQVDKKTGKAINPICPKCKNPLL
jgi:hypothetical protein